MRMMNMMKELWDPQCLESRRESVQKIGERMRGVVNRHSRARVVVSVSLYVLLSLGSLVAQPIRPASEGVYVEEQAERGEPVYQETCAACHMPDLLGDDFAPALSADMFAARWAGKPVGELFIIVKATMPADRPGSLDDKEYAAIVAFLLKMNGYAAGPQELSSDPKELAQIMFDKVGQSGSGRGSLTVGSPVLADGNWPEFRGSRAGVVDDDPVLPESWSRTENVIWKLDLPGLGWSSPIVWGDYIFVTSAISEKEETPPRPGLDRREGQGYALGSAKDPTSTVRRRWVLYAVDFRTGKIRWETELLNVVPREAKQRKNTYASETPVTDGNRVYVYIGSAHALVAVDFNGNVVWSSDVEQPTIAAHLVDGASRVPLSGDLLNMGAAASPTLHNDRLYIVSDHKGPPAAGHDVGEWFLAAFDARTGRELWRAHHLKKEDAYGWSTPFVWANELRSEIVTVGDNHVRSFGPDGKLLWELKGLSRNSTPTPFAAHGLLYVSSGYPGGFRPVYAIRPGASGDISLESGETSNEYVVWSARQLASYMPSALVYGDYLYHLHSLGLLQCNDAQTGRPIYGRQRVAVGAATFTASPWAYNGKIFALNEEGDTYVIQAGPEFKVLGKNALGEMALATPAVVRSSVIIRTVSALWRLGKTDSN